MSWLREAVCDNKTGRASSTRIVMLMSAVTLCLCTLWLTVAAFWEVALVPALTVFGGSLATLATGGYVAARVWPGKDEGKKDA